MKSNTKSSITLPAKELALVDQLRKQLKLKTKVEVIRRGLLLLKNTRGFVAWTSLSSLSTVSAATPLATRNRQNSNRDMYRICSPPGALQRLSQRIRIKTSTDVKANPYALADHNLENSKKLERFKKRLEKEEEEARIKASVLTIPTTPGGDIDLGKAVDVNRNVISEATQKNIRDMATFISKV